MKRLETSGSSIEAVCGSIMIPHYIESNLVKCEAVTKQYLWVDLGVRLVFYVKLLSFYFLFGK